MTPDLPSTRSTTPSSYPFNTLVITTQGVTFSQNINSYLEICVTIRCKFGKTVTNNLLGEHEMSAKPKNLVIDDDPNVRRAIEPALHYRGFEVITASGPEDGMK